MVSTYSRKVDIKNEKVFIAEYRGLSTDDKPIEIDGYEVGNGSVFIEIDTGNVFFYDAESQTWKEV